MAKKFKLTTHQLALLNQVFYRSRSGESLTSICKDIGVDRRTIYNWRQRPEWLEMEREIRQKLIDSAYESIMETIVERAVKGSSQHAKLYLQTTGRLKNIEEVHVKQELHVTDEGITEDMFAEIDRLLADSQK
ncbi:phBC6A51 family helix-turn-helix protein [Bacillus sp. BP-3]|uniref:phBC6A51 family helix-turn-helix protein n=1 Tax=Bacillus sp. BP-3 TaxID=3022773 RepID=UPI00232C248B|nr:phBC6A51 family helix-turn-helix protein [Bacillus sp. BP-3]MDC2864003.1 phBC6A51 family helix-turn-helix protein [Bacillus sp. BP-3]